MAINIPLAGAYADGTAIALPGAEIRYFPACDLGAAPTDILSRLISGTPWRQENIRLWGKSHAQPRLVAWYGDASKTYRYSGLSLTPLEWTPLLADLRNRVEELVSHRFNSALLNYYRDGSDHMGMHSDDEHELGAHPVIASLSLGQDRPLRFKNRHDKGQPALDIPLASGSLLLMQGDTQRNYRHGIPQTRRPLGQRVNITFRHIVD